MISRRSARALRPDLPGDVEARQAKFPKPHLVARNEESIDTSQLAPVKSFPMTRMAAQQGASEDVMTSSLPSSISSSERVPTADALLVGDAAAPALLLESPPSSLDHGPGDGGADLSLRSREVVLSFLRDAIAATERAKEGQR